MLVTLVKLIAWMHMVRFFDFVHSVELKQFGKKISTVRNMYIWQEYNET